MQVRFAKVQSSGSDHVVVESLGGVHPVGDDMLRGLARVLCNRSGPIGADGIVFLGDKVNGPTTVRILTPDGNEPDLCVNGLLCAARLLNDRKELGEGIVQRGTSRKVRALNDHRFPSGGFHIQGIEVSPTPSQSSLHAQESWLSQRIFKNLNSKVHLFDTGTPHAIAIVNDIDEAALDEIGVAANRERHVFPVGINISLCRILSDSRIFVRTFERGGAGLSLSCASATVASVHSCIVSGDLTATISGVEAITLGGLSIVNTASMGASFYGYSADVSRAFDASTIVTGTLVGPIVKGSAYMSEILAYGEYREKLLLAIDARSFVSGTGYV